MSRMPRGARTWALPLAVSILSGVTFATSTRAQPPEPSHPSASPSAEPEDQEQPQSAGILLTVPLEDYGTIVAQNAGKQKDVNLLNVTQAAVGDLNTQVATISIRQKNSQNKKKWEASAVCYLPMRSLNWIRQANKNTAIIEQAILGSGNQQVAQVQIYQNDAVDVKKGTRFMMCPRSALASILALNPANLNLVNVTQLAAGNDNSQVAVVSVDETNAGSVKVPAAAAGAMLELNLNLIIINQVAIGDGNTQVVTVNVGQANQL